MEKLKLQELLIGTNHESINNFKLVQHPEKVAPTRGRYLGVGAVIVCPAGLTRTRPGTGRAFSLEPAQVLYLGRQALTGRYY